jgi:sugar (pentulose or hexulose) kinase
MDHENAVKQAIIDGRTSLGIELGSTRIKAVLIGDDYAPIATGSHDWENQLKDGIWTYSLDDVWTGLQDSFSNLAGEVKSRYGVPIETVGAIGISAMMHGYLVFDEAENQLVPFRTWRNTTTEQAATKLTNAFNFNIPQRWSIAHLYQSILNREPHVGEISFITTLAGYIHWQLTGEKVLGVGDASGMFPIDGATNNYDSRMLDRFSSLIVGQEFARRLEDILPKVLSAGTCAGVLTEDGTKLLDPTGRLKPGIPLCPPEGDAGTGMVATNSVSERTGNVSAGTSIFAMVVLERELSKLHTEIDMVTTPAGKPVAMVHCNNCTTDLDAWIGLFGELLHTVNCETEKSDLYGLLYNKALEGDVECGGLLAYNYYGGEPITGVQEGRPLFVRMPDGRFTLANFMRTHLFSAIATLKWGLDILTDKEHVHIENLLGHGGFFKIPNVGQRLMAAALNTPVTVMESAGEGGAWGIALLADYMRRRNANETLEDYLAQKVFLRNEGTCIEPDEMETQGFAAFMKCYTNGFAIEQAAVAHLN